MSRRQEILNAAVGLFQRYGFRKTTVDEIARTAGIGKGSVYLEFRGKEDIFLALLEDHERGILEEIKQLATRPLPLCDRLTEAALVRPRRNVEEMARLPEVFEYLAALRGRVADRVRPYQTQCVAVVADLLREGIRSGEFCDRDPEDTARLFYQTFDVSFVFAMHGMDAAEIEDTLRKTALLFIHGLARCPEVS